MGLFDTTCAFSGIVLDDRARLFVLLETTDGKLEPALPPLVGTYDRYGKLEDITEGVVLDAAEALAKESNGEDFALFLDQAWDGEAKLGTRKLAYALVDDDIYRAVVATRAPELEAELEALSLPLLIERAVADPQLATTLFSGHAEDELRHALVSLALFRTFGRPLHAHSPDTDGGQFTEYAGDVQAYTEKARASFAEHPLLLAAIAENQERWVERGKENDDDDSDDDDDDDDRVAAFVPNVPGLAELLKLADAGELGELDFEMLTEFDEDAPAAYTQNPDAKQHLLVFAQDGTGGPIALWIEDAERPLTEQPIVFLDSEGQGEGVVAGDLAELFYLLGEGVGPMELVSYGLPDDAEPNTKVRALVKRRYAERSFEPVPTVVERLAKRTQAFQALCKTWKANAPKNQKR